MNWMQQISREIFEKNYMINEGDEDLEGVLMQVAETVSQPEKKKEHWKNIFFEEMLSGRLLPAGRILANARTESKNKYYNNCYTIDIDDSMEEIYDSLKSDALISATGGGVGFNISKLRPNNSPTSKGGVSSGPISFLKVFNESAKIIQTGGFRRAAHIAILNVDHPDIEEFITCKQGEQNNALTQFNISVGITDEFMNAVRHDLPWDLVFDGRVHKTVKAKELYELMTKNAYQHNEPGVFFLDRANRDNNAPDSFKIDRTNPCFTGTETVKIKINNKISDITIKEAVLLYENGVPFEVMSHNIEKEEKEFKNVEWAGLTKKSAEVIEITVKEDVSVYKLRCTPDHEIFTKNRGFVKASSLSESDDIVVDEAWSK